MGAGTCSVGQRFGCERQTRSIAAWAGPCDRSVRTVSFVGVRAVRFLGASDFDGWRALVSLLRLRLPPVVTAAAAVGPLAKKSSVSKNGTPIVRTARTQNNAKRNERLVGAILLRTLILLGIGPRGLLAWMFEEV